MATGSLATKVRRQNTIAVIDMSGEINALAEESLNGAYTEATEANPSAVLLNFAEVGYINSTGIALIVGVLMKARESATSIAACGLSDHFAEIFRITRLSDYMPIYPNEDTATQSFASGQ
jgi:anti-anti-sigma factor